MLEVEEWLDRWLGHEANGGIPKSEIDALATTDRPVLWVDLDKHEALFEALLDKPLESIRNGVTALREGFANLRDLPYPPEMAFYSEPVKKVGDFKYEKMGDWVSYKGQITEIVSPPDDLFEAHFDGCDCLGESKAMMIREPPKGFKEVMKCKTCGQNCYYNEDISVFCPSSYFEFVGLQDEANDAGQLPIVRVRVDGIMTDNAVPGKTATVSGVKRPPKPKEHMAYIHASSIRIMNDSDFEKTITEEDRKFLLSFAARHQEDSIQMLAKSAFGDWAEWQNVKEYLILHLIGGHVGKLSTENISPRIHISLIGSAGVAKSAMMKRVSQLSRRGVFVDAGLISGVGLTAAIDYDDKTGRKTLKPGAAVMADGGHLAIDDAQQMKQSEKEVLLGVMVNGQVVITKVVSATFNARCAMCFGLNPPKGIWDKNDTNIQEQTGFSAAFLSRCDILALMLDKPNREKDTAIVTSLTRKLRGIGSENGMTESLLRKYLYLASKTETSPTEEAETTLKAYFVNVRQQADGRPDGSLPVTPRQVATIWKLATAIAKSRLDPVTTKADVDRAILYYKQILGSFSTIQDTLGADDASVLDGTGTLSQKARMADVAKFLSDRPGKTFSIEEIAAEKKDMEPKEIEKLLEYLGEHRLAFKSRDNRWGWA